IRAGVTGRNERGTGAGLIWNTLLTASSGSAALECRSRRRIFHLPAKPISGYPHMETEGPDLWPAIIATTAFVRGRGIEVRCKTRPSLMRKGIGRCSLGTDWQTILRREECLPLAGFGLSSYPASLFWPRLALSCGLW